jgi:quinohemoprotein ethanol dehydrogenase
MRFDLRVVALLALALVSCGRRDAGVDDARLVKAGEDTADWLMYGRTYEDQRYSPLEQINEQTIGRLGLVWSREMGTSRGLEASPLVHDGVLFTTGAWSVVHAMDAKTGANVWTFDPKVARERSLFYCCDAVNRGVALYKGKVFVGTLDGRLIALDEKTGKQVWSVDTTEEGRPYSITSAPRVARGMVVIGNGGAEFGVRGYITAYDAETGKQVWRSYTVPGDPARGFESKALEVAAKTWTGEYWKVGGGGPAGEGIVYDPELDLLYFGTGNPTAWYRSIRGKGDNLYTASIVAVKAATGEIAWHFQTTPGDSWDYDATQPLVQATLPVGGTPRKVILQANKNGFFYVLDRKTGEFLSGKAFVGGVTWASGLDAKGRPVEAPGMATEKAVIASPSPDGAHNWHPMAFSPKTGLVYLAAKEGTQFVHAPDPEWKYNPDDANLGYNPNYDGALYAELAKMPPPKGSLLAWDPVAGKAAWRAPYPTVEGGGALVAGDLVFQGRGDGILAAYRARDGKDVWRFDTGTGIMAPPVTYTVDGTQYLSVMVGWGGPAGLFNSPASGAVKYGWGRIVTFALDGKATLKVPAYGHKEPPKPALPANAPPAVVQLGAQVYGNSCMFCHGINAVGGTLPDLRYASKETMEQFEEIVLRGSRASAGMPSFAKLLTPEKVRAVRAYVLARAAEGK